MYKARTMVTYLVSPRYLEAGHDGLQHRATLAVQKVHLRAHTTSFRILLSGIQ